MVCDSMIASDLPQPPPQALGLSQVHGLLARPQTYPHQFDPARLQRFTGIVCIVAVGVAAQRPLAGTSARRAGGRHLFAVVVAELSSRSHLALVACVATSQPCEP